MAIKFDYSVRDRAGKLVTGQLEADNQTLVVQKLKGMGYSPVTINASNTGANREIRIPGLSRKGKVKLKELAIFSRQFATMINSGLPLLRSLNILTEQTDNAEFSKVLREVRNDVETGVALSSALGRHPKVFPPLMVNMTKAGEIGGFLDSVMMQIAQNYEAEVKLRGKVKSAMTYPVVVFVMAILMCTAMLIFVVPTFAGIFSSLGGTLPAPTRAVVFLSNTLKSYFYIFAIIMIAMWVAYKKNKDKPGFRDVSDPLKLKMPVFGKLFQKIALARFARNLGTMMHSGVPILQSLDIVADTTGNVVLARAIRDVQDSVRTGEALAKPLENHPVFPSMVVQMMAVGEDTGALDTMLEKIAEFYDQEVEATTEQLTALIEPLMIAFLGIVVGSMIVAMYLPIFDVFNLIGS